MNQRAGLLLVMSSVLLGSACSSESSTDTNRELDTVTRNANLRCPEGITGARFTLCGKLSSSGIDLQRVAEKQLVGALDSTSQRSSSRRFSLRGGSFHANR